jgi:hypothetical protein
VKAAKRLPGFEEGFLLLLPPSRPAFQLDGLFSSVK